MHEIKNLHEVLVGQPNNLKFLDVWQRWRGERPIPIRRDVRPEMMGASIAAMTVFEVEAPERIIFRVSAGQIERLRTPDVRGLNYVDLAAPQYRDIRITRLNSLLNVPCGAVSDFPVVLSDGVNVQVQSLLLPVAGNTPADHGWLYSTGDLAGEKNWNPEAVFDHTPVATRFEFVDIGFGLPRDPG